MGRSNGTPNTPSTCALWPSPMPRANRPPAASWAALAWLASVTGWRGYIGTAAIPMVTRGTSRATRAATVMPSRSIPWLSQMSSTPAASASRARSVAKLSASAPPSAEAGAEVDSEIPKLMTPPPSR